MAKKKMKVSSGVQELITRLKDEGVKAGRDEAGRMTEEAQKKAAQIISQAKAEADQLMTETRAELETEKKAADASLKTAIRDTELMLESELKSGFAEHVKRLVSVELKDKEFLRQLILAVAGRVAPDVSVDKKAEVFVPRDLFTEEGKGNMHHMVLGIAGDMLREGVKIKKADTNEVGMRIRLVGEDVEIDLSDNAISDVLLKYLLPRYRAIMAGVE